MVKRLLAVGLLCASVVLAQRGGGGGGDRGGGGGGAPMMMMGAQNKLDSIANALTLSKDQKKAVKAIFDEGSKEAAPLREQVSKSRVAVGEAIVAKKSDEEIKQLAKASAELSAKLTHLEMKSFAKLVETLDDTQKADKNGMSRVLMTVIGIYKDKNWNEM